MECVMSQWTPSPTNLHPHVRDYLRDAVARFLEYADQVGVIPEMAGTVEMVGRLTLVASLAMSGMGIPAAIRVAERG